MTIRLRDYQDEAVQATLDAWGEGVRRPAVVLPTGAGKTVVFAGLAHRYLLGSTGDRPSNSPGVLVLAHRDELVSQAVHKISMVAPDLTVGVVKADRNELGRDVTVASVQTLRSAARRRDLVTGRPVGIGIVDECHHATAATYRTVMDECSDRWLGVTATMARGDRAKLGDVWDKIVFQRDIPWMIRKRYLADVTGYSVRVDDLDMTGVRLSGGDYREGDLGAALEDSHAPQVAAEKYLEHARVLDDRGDVVGLQPAILFAPTVDSAHAFTDAMVKAGVRAATVWGAMPLEERRQTLRDYEAGRLDVLCNCMVLTEGFDSPRATVAIIARPTTSAPLYVQMVGRVLRTYPGKRKALVLDIVGASAMHALATLATLAGSKPVEPKPGQTLLEALDELEQQVAEQVLGPDYDGPPVELEEIDLFHGSRQQWLKTRAGFWFLPAGERFIVIHPAIQGRTGYDVAWYGKKSGGGWVAQGVDDIGYAMAFGEGDLQFGEDTYATKRKGWRKRPASSQQVAFAIKLGAFGVPSDLESIPAPRAGELSDLISVALASARVDGPLLKRLGDPERDECRCAVIRMPPCAACERGV